jgi:hypothetical protein
MFLTTCYVEHKGLWTHVIHSFLTVVSHSVPCDLWSQKVSFNNTRISQFRQMLGHKFKIWEDILPNSRLTMNSHITFAVERVSLNNSMYPSSLLSTPPASNRRHRRQLSLAWRVALCLIAQHVGACVILLLCERRRLCITGVHVLLYGFRSK